MNEGEILELPVAEIGPGPLVRKDRLNLDHAHNLREAVDVVPAILVRETGKGWSLIDGQHRLSAARFEGRETIRAVVRAMDDAEALEAAIEANIGHGLALSLSERKSNAELLMKSTKYGNARIASICGLSGGVVGKMRPEPSGCPGVDLDTREGLDGKEYPSPAVAAMRKRKALELLAEDPSLSARDLAKKVGMSKSTAAEIIKSAAGRVDDAPPALPDSGAEGEPAPLGSQDETEGEPPTRAPLGLVTNAPSADPTVGELLDMCPVPGDWAKSCQQSNDAREFGRFMDRRLVRTKDVAVAADCPAEFRPGAKREALEAAAFWTDFAAALDNPTRLSAVEDQ